MRRIRSEESGQTLVIFVLFLFAMIGMAGLAIDVGYWVQQKRAVQAEADAAALAGASALPDGWSNATSTAGANIASNGKAGDAPTYTNTTNQTSNDSVTVSVTRKAQSFFTSVFGINSVSITASAQATVQSLTTVTGDGVMPWAVMKGSFTPGQPYSIYTDNSSSNNGAVSLPYVNSTNCPTPNGANPYRNEIDGTLTPCSISVGQALDTKPGQNAGPTRQGIDSRITNWQPLSAIVSYTNPAHATVLDSTSPQLVRIPLVEDMSGSTNWPNGSGQVRVVGFAWFVITGPPGYTNNGKTVTGVFVGLEAASTTGDVGGAWDPNSGLATTVVLTK